MIPQEHREQLVGTSISFIRVVTEIYGNEKGMELWATIADTIDSELKGQVFFSMLTGEFDNTVVIQPTPQIPDQIALIRTLRSITGLGLKEAKELSDKIVHLNIPVKIDLKGVERTQALFELRKVGANV